MPKVSITDSKGLVQSQGAGFESQKMPKSLITQANAVTILVSAAADAANVSYSGKYFVIASKSAKYQLYFSSVGGVAATVPSALPGHTLVAIGNIDADATGAAVATAIVAAIGAGAGAGLSDLTAVVGGGGHEDKVSISTVLPEKSAVPSSLGTLDATHLTTFSQLQRGSGDSTVALRPGAINLIDQPDFTANFTAIANDGTGGANNAKYTVADGDYPGQEITVVRAKPSGTNSLPALKVRFTNLRSQDGGLQEATDLTWQQDNQDDGSPLFKCAWDGTGWMTLMGDAATTEFGYSGIKAAN